MTRRPIAAGARGAVGRASLAVALAAVAVASTAAAPEAAAQPAPEARTPLGTDSIVARTARLAVAYDPGAGTMRVRVLDGAGRVVHTAQAPALYVDGVRQQRLAIVAREPAIHLRNAAVEMHLEPLGERSVAVAWTARDGRVRDFALHLQSDDQTQYYGTGERFNALNQRGYLLPVVTDDRYGNKGVGSYKPVPFFMSSRGFGVWVDTYAAGHLDLSATARFASVLRFPDTGLRVVFMAGPTLAEVLEEYTRLTGRTRVPPPWAFGLWKSRDVHHNRDSVLADVERLRRYRIPASVLVLDSPWETGYNDFVVNATQFADPPSMFARIRELGFELCLWLTPFVNDSNVVDARGILPASSNFGEAVRGGHLVRDSSGAVALSRWWKGRGGLVDFTDPRAAAWWHSQLASTRPYGARCFKADDGEGNFVPDAVFHDGTPARLMKNRYAVLYDSVMQAYVDERLGGDGVLITRTGYTGTQRFPFAWGGDNEASFAFDDGLPSVIVAAQNAALSGFALWGSDIAGYASRPTPEVFVRWTQFGAFTPFMQVHMTSNLGPWDFGDEALEIFRRFATLRVELFPYLYEAAHEAARTGLPVIRPMVLAFPGDIEAHRHVYQYLYGPDLLVAPMYQSGTRRVVYLPEGTWVDWWTGEALAGKRTIEVEAPLASMPLFVRAGAVLPMLPPDVQTLVPRHAAMAPDVVALDARRVLRVWPGEAGAVRTWEGLEATLAAEGPRRSLRVASTTPRPLELQLVGRRLEDLRVEGATVSHDAVTGHTVVRFERLAGTRTLIWTEP